MENQILLGKRNYFRKFLGKAYQYNAPFRTLKGMNVWIALEYKSSRLITNHKSLVTSH